MCITTAEKLKKIMSEMPKNDGKTAEERARAKAERERLLNEAKSEDLVAASTRPCPKCYSPIYKSQGCNKMVCSICTQKFCYSCNSCIQGYEHFSNTQCELYDSEEITRFNQRMQDDHFRQMWAANDGDGFDQEEWERRRRQREMAVRRHQPFVPFRERGAGHHCPNCGWWNNKLQRNNHHVCRNCNTKFCMQCTRMVRNTREHYSKGRCKQHS